MNTSDLKVSVITPSYNQGKYLEETIQSVLNQTYPNIEYIVIDGGSTDNSVDIIKKYEQNITYWISEKDKGQADAINKGFLKATGDLVCWINSDDILYSEFVATRVKQFLLFNDIDLIYGDVDQGDTYKNKLIRKGRQVCLKEMLTKLNVPIPQQSAMWRKSAIDKIGLLDERWHVILDREYFMRTALFGKIMYIEGSLAFFRNHNESKSIAQWHRWADELEFFYQEIFESNDYNQYIKHKGISLSSMYHECADIYNDCNNKKLKYRYKYKSFKSNYFVFFKLEFKALLIKIYKLSKKTIE